MNSGDIVEIIYQDKSGKFSQRYIRIIRVTETYVKAYCFTRRQIRIFSSSQILAMRKVKSA